MIARKASRGALSRIPRIKTAYAELDELRGRATWSRDDIEAFQLDRLNEVWAHAIAHVPFYRERNGAAGVPTAFDSLREFEAEVPLLDKNELRRDPDRFRSGASRGLQGTRGKWHYTSGSTGTPMRFYWPHDGHSSVLRSRYAFYADWGVDILAPSVFVWGGGEPGGWRGRAEHATQTVHDGLRMRLRLSAGALAGSDLAEALDRIDRHRPEMIYGYTQAVGVLGAAAAERGQAFPGLKVVVVTGEVATPRTIAALESDFGVPVVSEYGATECHLIAGTAPDGTIRVREDMVHVETIGRDDGRYDVVLSVLANPAFPLLRYVIDDVTAEPIQRPSEGFSVLGPIAGRDDDLILASTGAPVHSSVIDGIFEKRTDVVRRYQLRQAANGEIDVDVESRSAGELKSTILDDIRGELEEIAGEHAVRVRRVDVIESSPTGKHHVVRSEMVRGAVPAHGRS